MCLNFFVCFLIKSLKRNVIDSVLKGTFSCCVTFKTCSVLQDVTKYSRNFELYLFTVSIGFALITNPIGVQENIGTSFP